MYSSRPLLLILAVVALVAPPLRAIVTNPELDFINTPEDVAAEYGISKKDEIIRLELDITGNGQSTVFLTYKGTGSKGGAVWTAYSPTPEGYTRMDGLQFREDFVRAGKVDDLNPGGGLLVLYPGKGVGNLVRYRFDGGKAIQEDVQKIDYTNPVHQQLFERVFGRKLGEPMPDEFFKKPPHQVIEVTSIEARTALKSNGGTDETSANGTNKQANFPPSVKSPTATKINEAKPPTPPPSEEPPASTPWSVIVILIAVASGLLWLLLKRRE